MTVIDFHNHYYPPEWLDAVRKGPSRLRVTDDAAGNPMLHSPGDVNIAVPGHRDLAFRERVLNEVGVDRQVLTFTAPGTLIEEPEVALPLARLVNDCLARAVADRPTRFRALATLPLHDPAASVAEFERAVGELELPGAMLYGNANGVPLADERFWPLYERADARGAVLYIHPTYPLGVEAMTDYWLMPLCGFLFDTTLAAAHLVFAGVAERFPRIKWVLAHLGGTIPYLAERLDRGYEAFTACRTRIAKPPSEYLKVFWYDTVNFDPRALELALAFAGPDKLMAGSDYPHQIGSLERMLSSIRQLDLSEADRAKILGGNAEAMLGR